MYICIHRALHITPSIDCYWVGAGPKGYSTLDCRFQIGGVKAWDPQLMCARRGQVIFFAETAMDFLDYDLVYLFGFYLSLRVSKFLTGPGPRKKSARSDATKPMSVFVKP